MVDELIKKLGDEWIKEINKNNWVDMKFPEDPPKIYFELGDITISAGPLSSTESKNEYVMMLSQAKPYSQQVLSCLQKTGKPKERKDDKGRYLISVSSGLENIANGLKEVIKAYTQEQHSMQNR
jgi:hypothetical protein